MSHLVTGSGYLNSPVRTLLIADDNRPGSYPVQISPQIASKSGQFTKPYRDNVMPDTPVVYARAKVTFSGIPGSTETITLTNAASVSHTFTFRTNNVAFDAGPNAYNVKIFGLSSTATQYDAGLTTGQVLVKRAAERFISAVNSATGSLITASSTDKFNVVMLTQNIPGTAGNTTNSYVTDGEFVVENFTGGKSGTVRYPFGISIGSAGEVLDRVLSTDASGTLDVPTSGKAGLLSAYSDQHPYGVFQPYDESSAHQAFGVHTGGPRRYGTQARLSDEFFTRGSVSGSLDEPLWVKDKIEIDLTPTSTTVLRYTNTASIPTYGMAYYNFSNRKWEGAGTGYSSIDAYALGGSTSLASFDAFHAGFSQSCFMGYPVTESGWASCTDTFGFPVHPKYHATSSQTLKVSSLVDRPFVVEKIVYEFSGSSGGSAQILPGNHPIAGNKMINNCGGTFFILNQRVANPDPGQDTSYTSYYYANLSGVTYASPGWAGPLVSDLPPLGAIYTSSLPVNRVISRGGPPVYVNTVRDLVTFARVGAVWSDYDSEIVQNLDSPGDDHPAKFMDLAIEVPNSGTYGGYFTVATDVKSPQFNNTFSICIVTNDLRVFTSKQSNTRNSLDLPTGRALSSEYCSSFPLKTKMGISGNADQVVTFYESDANSSPYLILPGDSLVFGWQAPASFSHLYDGESFSIGPGKGKLFLYGSYLRDSKPVHDIYKDQLNSDAIHEALPTGPWVLDRFESEPQMMYTSSMREEHVTGTMVTRGADGSLVVTDVNDLGIGGVRAISAKASDGNLGQRWSFFRNNRLFDSDEQYYDSMQPNPIDRLNPPGLLEYLADSIILTLDAGSYIDPSNPTIASFVNSNKVSGYFGSFPFESSFSSIDRVKAINSSILNSKLLITNQGRVKSPTGIVIVTGSLAKNTVSKGGIYPQGLGQDWGDGIYILMTDPISDTNPVQKSLFPGNAPGTTIADPILSIASSPLSKLTCNFNLSRFLGCFGNGYLGLVQFNEYFAYPVFPAYFWNMTYRGTKHGLINPTPLFSNAVFNGTQFGQLRDMMEQRQYTRFSLSNNTLTSPAVSVEFINRSAAPGTLNITSGSATNSSNISQFATSEHPYDDALSDYEQIWDRSTVLPETLTAL
jgi:hypothetical protein